MEQKFGRRIGSRQKFSFSVEESPHHDQYITIAGGGEEDGAVYLRDKRRTAFNNLFRPPVCLCLCSKDLG